MTTKSVLNILEQEKGKANFLAIFLPSVDFLCGKAWVMLKEINHYLLSLGGDIALTERLCGEKS